MKLSHITEARLAPKTIDLVGRFRGEGVNTVEAEDIGVRLNVLRKSKVFSRQDYQQFEVEVTRIRNAPKEVAEYIQQHSGDDISYEVYDDGSWMLTGASWTMQAPYKSTNRRLARRHQ